MEAFSPAAIAQDDDIVGPRAGFLRPEEPAQRRRRAHQREQRRRQRCADQARSPVRQRHRVLRVAVRGHGFDRPRRLVPGVERQVAQQRLPQRRHRARMLLRQPYQTSAVRKRQRPEQHAVDDGKHGCGRADAERERQQSRGREARISTHDRDRVAHVARQCFESLHTCALYKLRMPKRLTRREFFQLTGGEVGSLKSEV